MIRIIFSFILSFSILSASAFESTLADSLHQKALSIGGTDGIEIMLDNFYSVHVQNYDDGIAWGKQTLNYAQQSGNQQLIGRSYLIIGMSSYMRGDYPNCLDNYQKALEIFEKINDLNYIGRTNNEFSVYWRKQKQFEKGLECLDKSFKACTDCKDSSCVETSLNNRAVIYEMMGRYEDAIFYYSKAEEIAMRNNNLIGLAYIYADGAECYRLKGQPDSSMIQINKSIAILEKAGNHQGVAMNLINKAALFSQTGQYDLAISTYQQCIDLASQLKYTDLLKNAHYQLGHTYAKDGDYEKSFYHIERSHFLQDSLLNEEKLKALSEMEVKYETEKIENDLLLEKQAGVETELKLANRNKWLIASAGFLIAFLFFGLFLYQRKSHLAQAEKDKAIIDEREKGIQAVFEATEEERKRLSRELHDGIGQQMSGLKLAWQNLTISSKTLSEEEKAKLQQLSKILDDTSSELREISHRMMPKVLESFGLVPAIEQMLEQSLKLSEIRYSFEHYNFDERISSKTELALFRISQELVNNVIKHARANFISVQLFKNQNQLILIIEDNGKGISEIEKTDGHGLMNIKSRLNTIHGQVNFESSTGAGTTATVRVLID
ncbi:MAG: sensor histidine kinase [Crocinitomicaceae bacterium]|nr:sensor histidine kinase [Crocinitomicaceae bacterium]